MLSGKGFQKIFNLSGGIKAWGKELAVGPEDSGLHLFGQVLKAEEAIITGFGLEMGLRDFYLAMQKRVSREATKTLFGKLADIEILHQEQLVRLYEEITGKRLSLGEFAAHIVEPAMEGGLTTEEYLQLYKTDLDSEAEILSLALAIEAQALDLYLRAADRSTDPGSEGVLRRIAAEERHHIERLGNYIDHQRDLP
jgi:rubrerythrin